MKIIHCADLHLDSGMQAHLNREQAKCRRDELLRNFGRLADYAAEHDVKVILIAGDLFDRDVVSALTANVVLAVIRDHPEIHFYYLRGNHDMGDCLGGGISDGKTPPENLFFFGPRWKTWFEGARSGIAIAGIELTRENNASAHASLRLDPARFNIVMVHGETDVGGAAVNESMRFEKARSSGRAGMISLRALRGRGIDYLALGHIHGRKSGKLDERGIYCYPGCLEGRGFDESGEKGFVLLEIDDRRHLKEFRFIPFAQRTLFAVKADVTGCRTSAEMGIRIRDCIRKSGCTSKDMVDVQICGELDVDCEKDTGYLTAGLAEQYFFARLRDRTTLRIDLEEYLYDESLRGEFVRQVMADETIPPEEKNEVIRCGFRAMDGEEVL